MSNDVSKSVSQGGYGAYDEENRRIREISDELHRCCQLYVAQFPKGKADGNNFEIEQRVTEEYAKSMDLCPKRRVSKCHERKREGRKKLKEH